MRRLSRCALVAILAVLGGCGTGTAESASARPTPVSSATAPAPASSPSEAPGAPAVPSTPPSTETNGAASPLPSPTRVVQSVTRGARTYELRETDAVAEGYAALDAAAYPEGIEEALGELVGECLHEERAFDCIVAISPNVGVLADLVAERGHGWSVAALEGGRVVASHGLVALSLHDLADPTTDRPTLEVADLDHDGRDEVLVTVPLTPLRDDSLFETGDDEDGAVAFVLDDQLAPEVRLTASWLVVSGIDDPESDEVPVPDAQTETEEFSNDGALTIRVGRTGNPDEDELVECSRDAAGAYRCPAEVEGPLLRPASPPGHHFVGETEAALRAQLPRLGTRLDEVRARAVALASEGADDAPPAVAPPATAAASTTSAAPSALGCVVQDPAPPLHVRAEPSSRAPIVGDLPNGTPPTLAERDGRWGRIEAPAVGWVWLASLSCPAP